LGGSGGGADDDISTVVVLGGSGGGADDDTSTVVFFEENRVFPDAIPKSCGPKITQSISTSKKGKFVVNIFCLVGEIDCHLLEDETDEEGRNQLSSGFFKLAVLV
jgi:hypothetical protein